MKNKNNRNKIRKKQKTEKEIKESLLHLEDEYRKASISEKDYKELKEKYSKKLEEFNMAKKDPPKKKEKTKEVKKEGETEKAKKKMKEVKDLFEGKKEKEDKLEVGEIEEVTPEVIEKLATQLSEQPEFEEEKKKGKKSGFFSRLFGGKKKKKSEEIEPTEVQETSTTPIEETVSEPQTYDEPVESYPAPAPTSIPAPAPAPVQTISPRFSELNKKITSLEVEIEKLKTILETVRETGHITDESIQTISEGIGELRSLIFQTDASLKETMVKMEKIEDDISEVKPKEIVKRFREFDTETEKHDLEIEKIQKKTEDANEKINKMYEVLKSIGGIENLVDINKRIQEKLKDVEEAVKYIGRIGAKTEKEFIDLSRGLDDLVLFKAKQEDIDESLKDIIKSIDALNVKFEGYMSKKDMDVFREDILLIKKQIENVSKVLPLVEVKIPEDIIDLRKEREDIMLLLDSLREQYEDKKITKAEYKSFKEGNEKRLKEIDKQLKKEWKKVEKMIRLTEKEKQVEQPPEQAKGAETKEEQSKEEEKPTEEVKIKEKLKEETENKKEEDKKPKTKTEEKIEKIKVKKKTKAKKKKKVKKPKRVKKRKGGKKLKILNEIKKMKV